MSREAIALIGLLLLGCDAPGAGEHASGRGPARVAAQRPHETSSAPRRSENGASSAPGAQRANGPGPHSVSTRRVRIGAAGDLLVHVKVARAAADHADAGGMLHVLGDLPSVIEPDEIAFINVETPLVDDEVPVGNGAPPILGSPPAMAEALARAGFDVASLANNHALDQGSRGLRRSIEALERAGVRVVGAASTYARAYDPVIVERDGLRVAFIAFTERMNQGPRQRPPEAYAARLANEASVLEALRRARQQADLVVASVHWSYDFAPAPTRDQRNLARRLVEHGADLVIGHGPHIVHGVQRLRSARGDAFVAYSLGNVLSNQGLRYRAGDGILTSEPERFDGRARDNVWLRVPVEVDASGTIHIGRPTAVLLWTRNNHYERASGREQRVDIRPIRLGRIGDEGLRAERRDHLARVLGPEVDLVD
ncbi:MAG: CapA family protein [Myxococcota bacterium]|nr:CapA family protein [Myxococcota bacterium]MDW8363586.1 CapA family protein [Myxococcales bacterium]